jgi:hypothetical protein
MATGESRTAILSQIAGFAVEQGNEAQGKGRWAVDKRLGLQG